MPPSTKLPASPAPASIFQFEPHLYLARKKQSLPKNWGWRKQDSLAGTLGVGICLLALARKDEAAKLFTELMEVIPDRTATENAYIWYLICQCASARSRILREAGDLDQADRLLDAARKARPEAHRKPDLLEELASVPVAIYNYAYHPAITQDNACRCLASVLARAIYRREAATGFEFSNWYKAEDLEATIVEGLALLEKRLNSKKAVPCPDNLSPLPHGQFDSRSRGRPESRTPTEAMSQMQ